MTGTTANGCRWARDDYCKSSRAKGCTGSQTLGAEFAVSGVLCLGDACDVRKGHRIVACGKKQRLISRNIGCEYDRSTRDP